MFLIIIFHFAGEDRIRFPGNLHGRVRDEDLRLRLRDARWLLSAERLEFARFHYRRHRVRQFNHIYPQYYLCVDFSLRFLTNEGVRRKVKEECKVIIQGYLYLDLVR